MLGRPSAASGLRTLAGSLSDARRGALLYVAAGLVFVTSDSITKTLVSDLPVIHVVFGRNLAYLLALLAFAGRRGPRRLLATRRPWTQTGRGLAMFVNTALFFLSLSLLPFAEAYTLGSTAPLIVVALAGPLLGERVTRTAVVGALVGFGGVLLLVGFDPSHVNLAFVVPLASALTFALFGMGTRSLADEPAEVTLFWTGVVALAVAAVVEVAITTDRSPTTVQWAAVGAVGVLSLTAHRLLVTAYRWGRASDMAPLGYLQLTWSFVIGALAFGEPVSPQAVAGAAAIIGGGVAAMRAGPPEERAVAQTVECPGPLEPEDA